MNTDVDPYQALGVSAGKAAVHRASANLDKGLYPGAFCRIFPSPFDTHRCKILHADGAGTKVLLAYLAEKFSAEDAWYKPVIDAIVMNIDDLACVGAIKYFMLVQLLSRNTFLVPDTVVTEMMGVSRFYCEWLTRMGFTTTYAGGETEDTPDLTRTITVSCAVEVEMLRTRVVDASRMRPGDSIAGFSSTGQAVWENSQNSGISSNALTMGRHYLLSSQYAMPETFAPELPPERRYQGKYSLDDELPGDSRFSIGTALSCPTRTYLPLIAKILEVVGTDAVHGFIHCTGGGQSKIRKFGGGLNVNGHGNLYVKDKLFPEPAIFAALRQARGLSFWDMYRTCNMGHRLEAVGSLDAMRKAVEIAQALGIDAEIIGRVEESPDAENRVIIRSAVTGELRYGAKDE